MSESLGSSPLTRGKRARHVARTHEKGLIPAHAGKTCAQARAACPTRAHPRSRGENIVDKPNVLAGLGSSPLTRGKHALTAIVPRGTRLIPAHAGKTIRAVQLSCSVGAHPRSRGENALKAWFALTPGGSSPLTRGKRALSTKDVLCFGLIPAHAGKTPSRVLARPP